MTLGARSKGLGLIIIIFFSLPYKSVDPAITPCPGFLFKSSPLAAEVRVWHLRLAAL